jgi:hypothetical protein
LRAPVRVSTLFRMNKPLTRIVLSSLLALSLAACAASDSAKPYDDTPEPASGIGTSPNPPEGGVIIELHLAALKAGEVRSCGLWVADALDLALARHDAAPISPDAAQYPLPGGLACSALIAGAPAIVANRCATCAGVVFYLP